MKKSAQRDANTALQKFSPRRRPLSGGAGPPKFNQLEMVTTCTYGPNLVKIDARNFELSWWQSPPATNAVRPSFRPPQTGPITIHCADMLSAQCNQSKIAKAAETIRWIHVSTFQHCPCSAMEKFLYKIRRFTSPPKSNHHLQVTHPKKNKIQRHLLE